MITHLVKVQVVQTCNNNIFIFPSVFNDIYNIFLLSVLLHTTEMTSQLEPQAASCHFAAKFSSIICILQ